MRHQIVRTIPNDPMVWQEAERWFVEHESEIRAGQMHSDCNYTGRDFRLASIMGKYGEIISGRRCYDRIVDMGTSPETGDTPDFTMPDGTKCDAKTVKAIWPDGRPKGHTYLLARVDRLLRHRDWHLLLVQIWDEISAIRGVITTEELLARIAAKNPPKLQTAADVNRALARGDDLILANDFIDKRTGRRHLNVFARHDTLFDTVLWEQAHQAAPTPTSDRRVVAIREHELD